MLYLTRHACTLYSKRGNRVYRFQELAEQVRAEVPRRELILDGEIVAIDDEGWINFWELMRGGDAGLCRFRCALAQRTGFAEPATHQTETTSPANVPAGVGASSRVPCFEAEGRELF
jgi:hypothetical protein